MPLQKRMTSSLGWFLLKDWLRKSVSWSKRGGAQAGKLSNFVLTLPVPQCIQTPCALYRTKKGKQFHATRLSRQVWKTVEHLRGKKTALAWQIYCKWLLLGMQTDTRASKKFSKSKDKLHNREMHWYNTEIEQSRNAL